MTTLSIEACVLSLVAKSVKPQLRDQVHVNSDLRTDLGFDSLGIVSLLFACEEVIGAGAELAEVDVNVKVVRTVGDVVELAREAFPRVSHAS